MTREQAVEMGFEFYGTFGLAKVYITDPRDSEPTIMAAGFFSEIIMDIQEGIMAFLAMIGRPMDHIEIMLESHADGSEIKENEL